MRFMSITCRKLCSGLDPALLVLIDSTFTYQVGERGEMDKLVEATLVSAASQVT